MYCLVLFVCIFVLNISGTYNMYSDSIILKIKLGIVLFVNSPTELDKINIIKIIIMVMAVTVTTCRACTMLADIMLFDLFDLIRRRCWLWRQHHKLYSLDHHEILAKEITSRYGLFKPSPRQRWSDRVGQVWSFSESTFEVFGHACVQCTKQINLNVESNVSPP